MCGALACLRVLREEELNHGLIVQMVAVLAYDSIVRVAHLTSAEQRSIREWRKRYRLARSRTATVLWPSERVGARRVHFTEASLSAFAQDLWRSARHTGLLHYMYSNHNEL